MNETGTEMDRLVAKQRVYFNSGATRGYAMRKKQLYLLQEALDRYESIFLEALEEDLGKSPFESYATELGMVKGELRDTIRHLAGWMGVEKVNTPLLQFPARSRIYREPLGVTLVLAPWNYPLQLCMMPLIASMAAGNCTIVRPSAHAPNTAEVMDKMIKECFDSEFVSVVMGTVCRDELLELRFDHIFFTGSPAVGKVILQTAAAHLTPVTLELGGKSPCIVDETADVDLAARRIVWGKCLNAGQTCVAPDYVLVQESRKEQLIEAMGRYLLAFYGEEPLKSKDLPRIINQTHFRRLESLLQKGTIRFGGGSDAKAQKIEPTILTEVTRYDPIMQQEIFGPLLPVFGYDQLREAIAFVKEGEKPLSLYFFTKSRKNEKTVMTSLSFGGGCINDTVLHVANAHLPFGGVGQSGMGAYHGRKGFDTFSHEKSVLKKSNWLDFSLRYPPYTAKKLKKLKWMMK